MDELDPPPSLPPLVRLHLGRNLADVYRVSAPPPDRLTDALANLDDTGVIQRHGNGGTTGAVGFGFASRVLRNAGAFLGRARSR